MGAMTSEMKIEVDWLPPFQGTEEIGRTSASIQIHFGLENATRFEDAWSESIQQGARVPAYPLALWLASSWWRIRWEPAPSRIALAANAHAADSNWRMSHELPAAGYGFLWPQLTFCSDGEGILVNCRRSSSLSSEPVRYLSEFESFVPAEVFERETDAFLDLVLRRLDKLGRTDLHALWEEIQEERGSQTQSALRRREAQLGFDPDEAPGELMTSLFRLAATAGEAAIDEIASACAGSDPAQELSKVESLAGQEGIRGRIDLPRQSGGIDPLAPPWQRGRQLSASVRKSLGIGLAPLNDKDLAALLQIRSEDLRQSAGSAAISPVGLAVKNGSHESFNLHFRKRNPAARRFEAARFLADYLCSRDAWLPVTDTGTARQKVQRAFAAEFLCPIDGLKEYLGDDFVPEALEDAAEHFGISEMAIESHLANNGLISRGFAHSR
jgi:hypothetical protein